MDAMTQLQRARGAVRLTMRQDGGRSRIAHLFQEGSAKLRFPRLADAQAVFVNTAGGMAGGDAVTIEVDVEAGAELTVTTQAAERVYRAHGGSARVDNRLQVAQGASLSWLPQETILYDAAGLERSFTVDLAADSRFLACESIVLGRTAMGETVRSGHLADRWRLRRDGRLVYADDLVLSGAVDRIGARAAALDGARAMASILVQGPDGPAHLARLRATLPDSAGASLVEGLLVVRILAEDGFALRAMLPPLLQALAKRPLPRLWSL